MGWLEKDYAGALAYSKQSLQVLEKYTGRAAGYAAVLAKQGIIEADSSDFDAAQETLTALNGLPEDVVGVWPDVLNLYITARQDGIGSARALYQDSAFPEQTIEKNLVPGYFLNLLKENGLTL